MSVHARWVRAPHAAGGPRSDETGSVHLVFRGKRKKNPCEGFDEETELEQLRETIAKAYLPAGPGSDDALAARFLITRHLKRLLRCTGEIGKGEAVVREMVSDEAEQRAAIDDASKPLGGYTAAVASWASYPRNAFRAAGARIVSLRGHPIELDKDHRWGPGTPYGKPQHRAESTKSAATTERVLRKTDILALSGHHYTSHLAPGFFTSANSQQGFDLRYNLVRDPAGFPNIGLVAVSGCSSLCTLAQRVLKACFPAARFVGARNTMTLGAGQEIWPRFSALLDEQATPLLLDNDHDLDLLSDVWRDACIGGMRDEAIRLLREGGEHPNDQRILAKQRQLIARTGLGHAEAGQTSLLVDETGARVSGNIGDPVNACERKADDSAFLVAPSDFVLPDL